MDRKTLLIIKHGFSEACDHNVSPVVSYSDVFRCTCILEDFKGFHVSWITACAAQDLLRENHLIDQLILADSPNQLNRNDLFDRYDMVINLEKQRDWCEFVEQISADCKYGFKDWVGGNDECFYPASAKALAAGLDQQDYHPLQETLFKSIGREWFGQRYVLGYQPHNTEIYDIGLNFHIGPKWPTKAWPLSYWQRLHERLEQNYSVCWQQSLDSIRHYVDWLNSCRLIVTTDSLGLHLALGLRKKIVALFGPTPPEQVHMYDCGIKLTPGCDRDCVPCFQARCAYKKSCMEYLTVDMVLEAVEMVLHPHRKPATAAWQEADLLVTS